MSLPSRSPIIALSLAALLALAGCAAQPTPASSVDPNSPEGQINVQIQAAIQNLVDSDPATACALLNAELAGQCTDLVRGAKDSAIGKGLLEQVKQTEIVSSQIDPTSGQGQVEARILGFTVKLAAARQADGTWQFNLG